jgi:hypothetical protein
MESEFVDGVEETKEIESVTSAQCLVFKDPEQLEEILESKLYDQKLKHCVEKLDIVDNKDAIEKLKVYLDEPDRVFEIITEEDIFNLFITNFKKLI